MTRSRMAGLLGIAMSVAAVMWACSSDYAAAPESAEGGDATAEAAILDASTPDAGVADANVADAADAARPSPCLDGGGNVLFTSTFENRMGPSLSGWTLSLSGSASIVAATSSAGAVARGSVPKGN